MSNFDDLIAEHCPNGVEFVEIGNLVDPTSKIKWADHDGEKLSYIDLSSVDRNSNQITATETVGQESAPSRAQQLVRVRDVLFGTTRPMLKRYCIVTEKYDGQLASTGFCVLRPGERITAEWLFHLLGTPDFYTYIEANQRGASYPAIPDRVVKNFKIPVPPLAVQRAISRFLSDFAKLEAELETELEAELEARRTQFVFYSEKLLSEPDGPRVQLSMGEATSLIIDHRGKTPKKLGGDWTSTGHRVISALNIKGGAVDDNDHHYISGAIYAKWMTQPLSPGDVLVTSEAPLGAVAFVDAEVDWALGQRLFALRPRPGVLDGRYLYHQLRAGRSRQDLMARATGSTVSGIRQSELVKVNLDLPSVPEQKQIAETLDHLEAVTSNLVLELPAELRARREQYEYYRDRLLSFEEAVA